MNLPEIFSSLDSLRTAFESGLDRQPDEDSLGDFILVLANFLLDEKIFIQFNIACKTNTNLRNRNFPAHSGRENRCMMHPMTCWSF